MKISNKRLWDFRKPSTCIHSGFQKIGSNFPVVGSHVGKGA